MNNERIARSEQIVVLYQSLQGADEPADSLADLLTDLMHWANARGVDFETARNKAEFYYGDEALADG